ncbi:MULTISPECIES: hypothetical protein [unclassified Rhizobium]|uniref:hypothetical protein n=1 Tax=unclassified Rhizobium TaxID=2613769 RepID=UPI00104A6964|nr:MULTISPECIES: hypothetical protein [unclassified Rhizobium]MBB3395022.1 hypothetical protein [Rhizobium sp. BK060]MBB4167397.1 hypothetical protein [Rhizobium sp. BK538]TCM63863.1 hypothetical protein EV291_1479 [Rhizobium sp. BK068]
MTDAAAVGDDKATGAAPVGEAKTTGAAPVGDDVVKRNSEVRSNIRDMARWLIVGLGAIVTFAIGGSSLTQLGSMGFGSRFWFATFSLVLGLAACVLPLVRAIDLMTMRIYARDEVFTNQRFERARSEVERLILRDKLYEPYRKFGTLNDLFEEITAEIKDQMTRGEDPDYTAYDAVEPNVRQAVEYALTQYTRDRFDALLSNMKWVLPIFGALILVFLILANPGKEDPNKQVPPFPLKIAWNASDEAVLKAAGIGQGCTKVSQSALYVLTEGLRPEVLAVPPDLQTGSCKVVRVTLDSDRHLALP